MLLSRGGANYARDAAIPSLLKYGSQGKRPGGLACASVFALRRGGRVPLFPAAVSFLSGAWHAGNERDYLYATSEGGRIKRLSPARQRGITYMSVYLYVRVARRHYDRQCKCCAKGRSMTHGTHVLPPGSAEGEARRRRGSFRIAAREGRAGLQQKSPDSARCASQAPRKAALTTIFCTTHALGQREMTFSLPADCLPSC